MAFSGALTLTDLNDYLGPSQACIKPVSGKDAPSEEVAKQDAAGAASTEIAIDADGEYYESSSSAQQLLARQRDAEQADSKPRQRTRLETAEISLNDCLACSGCVTSAETVLIGLQSVDELRKMVDLKGTLAEDAPTHFIASISPQSLASLSAKYSSSLTRPLPLHTILQRITDFLRQQMKFDVVIDTSFARHMSLAEQAKEFEERKRSAEDDSQSTPTLPMLASACPGWICYAEKTHGELIPLISKTRSPQQIAGVLAKKYLIRDAPNEADRGRKRIYHMTVMPCYDKKLEASRQDFFDDVTQTRDVDLVITTGELDDLMQTEGFDIGAEAIEAPKSPLVTTPPSSHSGEQESTDESESLPILLDEPGSSSGSYLFDLMKRIWIDHLQSVQPSSPAPRPILSVKTIRSADYTEYVLRSSDDEAGRILFKGAQCYGFRNLQNLVRKVQRQTGLKSKKASAASLMDGPSNLASGGRTARRGAAAALRARGRGGMVRRGRGNIAGGATDSSQGRTREGSSLATQVVTAADGGAEAALEPVASKEDEELRGYDFVEVMACPGGCVNGGGQIQPPGQEHANGESSSLTARTITADVTEAMVDGGSASHANNKSTDPEGYVSGWSTPPLSVSSEGGPFGDIGDKMAVDGEEASIQGWKGTTKEWVKRVEYLYWRAAIRHSIVEADGDGLSGAGGEGEGALIGSVHQAQASGIARDVVSERIAATLAASAAAQLTPSSHPKLSLDHLVGQVISTICQITASRSAQDASVTRTHLLRTQYRALQDEAVSGLAVQW